MVEHISASLLSNAALIVLFAVVWSRLDLWLEGKSPGLKPLGHSLLGGLTAVSAMVFPVHIATGIFVDMRTLVLSLTAMVGGPLVGLAAATIASLYRFWVGGAGLGAGLLNILLSTALGVYIGLRNDHALFRNYCLFLVTLGTGIAPGLTIFLLPEQMWATALEKLVWLAPLQCVATLFAGLLMRSEARHREEIGLAFFHKAMAETYPESLNAKDRQGRFILANTATARSFNLESPDDLIGKTDADLHPPDMAARYKADEDKVYEKGEAMHIEQPFVMADGRRGWFSTLKNPIRDPRTGDIVGLFTHNRDITQQKELERQLDESRRQLSDALSNMADGLVMFDREARLVFCNERYRSLFSKTAEMRVPGAKLGDIVAASKACGEEIADDASAAGESLPTLPAPGTGEVRLWDGRILEARIRSVGGGGIIAVYTDVTRTRQAEEFLRGMNRDLEKAAFTDSLTGLFNRRAFDERLSVEFARARRGHEPLSLLMVDIDHFKLFNDRYGHQAGDDCLRAVAGELVRAARRSTDFAARYGGEEMVLVLPGTDAAGAREVAERYCRAVRALAIAHAGNPKKIVTVSIGVAVFVPDGGVRADELIAAADNALYAVKNGGRDGFRFAENVLARANPAAAPLRELR
ncbi:diguanylate cyclase [Allorhizobium undicola]|uniref:diguanylate cyclase n=1 Tax=Allorhizobium undicola TaxID=78527 RepID=UPI000688740C|nr:diguanylate cyclase [Allorhizobium undicola]